VPHNHTYIEVEAPDGTVTVRPLTEEDGPDTFPWSSERWSMQDHLDTKDIDPDTGKRHTVMVSTVFLSVVHGHRDGKPVLYETMVFGDGSWGEVGEVLRYTSREEAIAGHQRTVGVWHALIDAALPGTFPRPK